MDVSATGWFSPNGRHVVFPVSVDPASLESRLRIVDLATGSVAVVPTQTVNPYPVVVTNTEVLFASSSNIDVGLQVLRASLATGAVVPLLSAQTGISRAIDARISSDGERIVVLAEENERYKYALHLIDRNDGSGRKISGIESYLGRIINFDFSPDLSHVVYVVRDPVHSMDELYSTRIADGNVTKLSPPMFSNRDVVNFRISSDSKYVVYRADADQDGVFDLYSVPVSGGVVSKVSADHSARGGVQWLTHYRITPDATKVVYITAVGTNRSRRLFVAPIAGGQPIELSGSIVEDGSVFDFRLSADSRWVAFVGNLENLSGTSIYSARIEGGDRTKLLNSGLAGSLISDYFEVTPNSEQVVFRAKLSEPDTIELFSARIDGSDTKAISGQIASGGGVEPSVRISPDSTRAVYVADALNDGVFELFSSSLSSGLPVKLSGLLTAGGDVQLGAEICPNGARVVFRADKEVNDMVELFVAPIRGQSLALDIDGDDQVRKQTDLLLLLRYQLGFRGVHLTEGAVAENARQQSHDQLESRIATLLADSTFDIDGDGEVNALTDLTMVYRFASGTRGQALVANALGSNSVVTDPILLAERISVLLAR